MKSWTRPEVPRLPGHGPVPRLWDTPTGGVIATEPEAIASIYVCGITPYDATHIGHAATYVAYDTLIRLWLDAGSDVRYVQNITDVDDPLLERATATGVDWRELAASQVDLFRTDMTSLRVIPADFYVAVTEMISPIATAVQRLLEIGVAYRVDDDVYFDIAAASVTSNWYPGKESGLARDEMLVLSAQRGGDPHRAGKRDPLDPLLWRAAREGEPSWPSVVGEGRPGWHIECSVIADTLLDLPLTVGGGGIDLAFPHHEFTAAHTAALTGLDHAHLWSHAGLVGYEGEKMSKSLGNLVLVSDLREAGVDPQAIRLAILAHHYRSGWEWTASVLDAARQRLQRWQSWRATLPPSTALPRGTAAATVADDLRRTLSYDLDTPAALATIDARIERGTAPTSDDLAAIDALLGVRL